MANRRVAPAKEFTITSVRALRDKALMKADIAESPLVHWERLGRVCFWMASRR